jgi:hypothetical protein
MGVTLGVTSFRPIKKAIVGDTKAPVKAANEEQTSKKRPRRSAKLLGRIKTPTEKSRKSLTN